MKFPQYKQVITLIPGGCPQFLDFGLDLEPLRRERRAFREQKKETVGESRYTHYLICLGPDDPDDEDTRGMLFNMCDALGTRPPETGRPTPQDESYTVTLEQALECFRGEWLPMPFLRASGQTWPDGRQRVDRGPSNWARGMFIPTQDDPAVWHLVILFDTKVEEKPENPQGRYFALSPEDLSSAAEFLLAWHVRDNSWYMNEPWVDEWVRTCHDAWRQGQRRGYIQGEWCQEHLACYMTWLDAARRAMGDVRVRVTDASRSSAIDVDLILDIGNSRTTGILVETTSNRSTSLNDSYLLELRDLTDPNQSYSHPFETRVEFYDIAFGNGRLSRQSGRRTTAFAWPSCVRVGPEATRLATYAVCAEGNTGMSSPKRYLWDDNAWTQSWRYNTKGQKEPPVTSGLFPGKVNALGTPRFCLEEGYRGKLPVSPRGQSHDIALYSHFTRSSLMMFMVAEIVTQALVQINSPANRNNRMLSDRPRQLRRVIFTVPSAMPVAERRIFQAWVELAIELIWRCLGWTGEREDQAFSYQKAPTALCEWDEASCSQLVLLYNEIMVKHVGNAVQYFRLFGRERDTGDGERRPSVRVASIDIGGGTTDLSITTHVLASEASQTPRIVPHMDFRDGFNIAGDEVVRELIRNHVIPAIDRAMERRRGASVRNVRETLFGRYTQGKTQQRRMSQGQFVHLVAVPVALGILQACEGLGTDDEGSYTCLIGDFFIQPEQEKGDGRRLGAARKAKTASLPEEPLEVPSGSTRYTVTRPGATMPQEKVLNYFSEVVAENGGGEKVNVLDIPVTFSLNTVSETIRRTLSGTLTSLCEMVRAYDADLLLVTGRPSAWKGVIQTILAKPPLTPERVIPMRTYHVGSWYPCADTNGCIADPKSTVVVGAILCALSSGYLQGINFDASRMRLASTARYVGELNINGQLEKQKVWFTVDDDGTVEPDEFEVTYHSPITIGYRQLAVDRWPASRYYLLDFPDKSKLGPGPYKITVRLDNQSGFSRADGDLQTEGEISVLSVEDVNGGTPPKAVAKLQTLPTTDGYWLDTGIVIMQ